MCIRPWPRCRRSGSADPLNLVPEPPPVLVDTVQHIFCQKARHMSAAKAGSSPDIQFLAKEIYDLKIERQVDLPLIEEMYGFQPGNNAGNAIKPAACWHCVDMRANDHPAWAG